MSFLHRTRGLSVLAGRIESVPRNNKTNKDKNKTNEESKTEHSHFHQNVSRLWVASISALRKRQSDTQPGTCKAKSSVKIFREMSACAIFSMILNMSSYLT